MTSNLEHAIPPRPAFVTVDGWLNISGMGRRATYDAIGLGHLCAVKRGSRTLIDVDHGLAWLRSLPPARIKPPRARVPDAAA